MSRPREKWAHMTGTRRDDNLRRERSPTASLGHRETAVVTPGPSLFSTPDADSIAMAVQAAGTAEDPATIAGSLVALIDELQDTLENPSTGRARSAVGRDMVRDAKWSQPVRIQHTLWAAV